MLSYAVITPVRNERDNLSRLADALFAQTVSPGEWIVVDNGSTDGTLEAMEGLARNDARIRLLAIPGEPNPVRGGPIVRAFTAGLAALVEEPDIVVKVDADISMEPDYFERLLGHFEADASLGIAGGICYEQESGVWVPRHSTGSHVRGASRAYRWDCLQQVLPLEERLGWDGIDQLKANTRGWRTATISDLPFWHHRRLGERHGRQAWIDQGRASYYMGYRLPYLLLRALHRVRRDPAAIALVTGYLGAAIRREPRYSDPGVRAFLRRQQSIRNVPRRIQEALGRRG